MPTPTPRPLLRLRRSVPVALSLIAAGCASLPDRAPGVALGCEHARDGEHARAVAIFARVIAEPVCVLDARGYCHMRYAPGAVVIQPVAWSAGPPAAVLAAGLERRGLDVGIVTPRRASRQFASLAGAGDAHPEMTIHLGAIELGDGGASATVPVHVLGPNVTRRLDVDPVAPDGGTVYRLVRIDPSRGVPRRVLSPANACWQLDAAQRSVLAE